MDELDALTMELLAKLEELPPECSGLRDLWLRTLGLIALDKLEQQALLPTPRLKPTIH